MADWDGVQLWGGGDAVQVRARLAEGADPGAPYGYRGQTALHAAAELASPEVVAAMAESARELDRLAEGRSALWQAVYAERFDIARVLVAAGADPWLSMMAGWSPGRLSLAGPEPDLFPGRPEGVSLTPVEAEAAALGSELRARLGGLVLDGTGLLCVADVDTAEVVRRLDATPMSDEELLSYYRVEVADEDEDQDEDEDEDNWYDWHWLPELEDLRLVGVTDVPGGAWSPSRGATSRKRLWSAGRFPSGRSPTGCSRIRRAATREVSSSMGRSRVGTSPPAVPRRRTQQAMRSCAVTSTATARPPMPAVTWACARRRPARSRAARPTPGYCCPSATPSAD